MDRTFGWWAAAIIGVATLEADAKHVDVRNPNVTSLSSQQVRRGSASLRHHSRWQFIRCTLCSCVVTETALGSI